MSLEILVLASNFLSVLLPSSGNSEQLKMWDANLVESDILVGPELMVPILCPLPQVP